MIFSNKARLLLDFCRVFQNVSRCDLYICLDTGVATFVKHDVTKEEDLRDFQDRLFSFGSNITELIFVTSYASY